MANWRHKINLNQVIANCDEQDLEGDDFVPQKTREELKAEINKLPGSLLDDYRVVDFLERLEDEITVEELDECLSDFYDWADDNLVWCGMAV